MKLKYQKHLACDIKVIHMTKTRIKQKMMLRPCLCCQACRRRKMGKRPCAGTQGAHIAPVNVRGRMYGEFFVMSPAAKGLCPLEPDWGKELDCHYTICVISPGSLMGNRCCFYLKTLENFYKHTTAPILREKYFK